jgi:hypothetical protein
MLTPLAAAKAADVDVATITTWINGGRVIALPTSRGGHRLPCWQFVPAIWDALPPLSKSLGSGEPWRLLSFLETPLGGLGGLTPRRALEQGELRLVLALATEEA